MTAVSPLHRSVQGDNYQLELYLHRALLFVRLQSAEGPSWRDSRGSFSQRQLLCQSNHGDEPNCCRAESGKDPLLDSHI